MIRVVDLFCLISVASVVGATEVEGRITDAADKSARGAQVSVTCGSRYNRSKTIGESGRYRFGDVPDGAACQLGIAFGGATAKPYSFRAISGKLTFNRQIKKYGNRLVVF